MPLSTACGDRCMCNKCSLYRNCVCFPERYPQLSKFFHFHVHLKTKYTVAKEVLFAVG